MKMIHLLKVMIFVVVQSLYSAEKRAGTIELSVHRFVVEDFLNQDIHSNSQEDILRVLGEEKTKIFLKMVAKNKIQFISYWASKDILVRDVTRLYERLRKSVNNRKSVTVFSSVEEELLLVDDFFDSLVGKDLMNQVVSVMLFDDKK